jgi:hypothetical protein
LNTGNVNILLCPERDLHALVIRLRSSFSRSSRLRENDKEWQGAVFIISDENKKMLT